MTRKYTLKEIDKLFGKKIFFDANILIYLFWSTGSMRWETLYGEAFGKIIPQGNECIVNFTVLSEFVNRTHRIEYERFLGRTRNSKKDYPYKKFRNSDDGKTSLSDIYLILKESVLSDFSVMDKSFTKSDLEKFLTVDSLDFGDKPILEICKENNLVLFTNDSDFNGFDIEILTAR